MKLGPDYRRPEPPYDTPDTFQHAEDNPGPGGMEEQWWRLFGDSRLNELVNDVVKNNLDLKVATARVLEVKARLVQAKADRFPSLSLQADAQRRRQVEITSGRAISTDRESSNYSLSLPASFELDLWGRLARVQEAARAELLAARENRHTVAQTIVSETVSLYFRMESLERRIALNKRTVNSYEKSVELLKARYQRGLTDVLDLVQARRSVSQAKSILPTLQEELGKTQQALAVLLGRYPETEPTRSQPEVYFKDLPSVPPGLPSDLLLRRPDIRQAEAQLMALNARIGVTKAARFPRLTLTGNLGYTTDELDRLFTPANYLWNIALGVAQPLFDAGRLKAGQEAAVARYEQGVADYAKVVLAAFAEVEGALLTREKQLERRAILLDLIKEARDTYDIAQKRYLRGVVDYLTVLDAQKRYLEAQDNLVLTELALLTNRVTLHRALGGGWGSVVPTGNSAEAVKTPSQQS
jgi:multidrug efflux system outer membrane protein